MANGLCLGVPPQNRQQTVLIKYLCAAVESTLWLLWMVWSGERNLVLGNREEVEDLGVVVDGFIEAAVVALDNIINELQNADSLAL